MPCFARRLSFSALLFFCAALHAQQSSSHADLLRGAYGPYRTNNDLLYYHLDIRVDPDTQTITGKNTIRFKMLSDGSRIQIDLSSRWSKSRRRGGLQGSQTKDCPAVVM